MTGFLRFFYGGHKGIRRERRVKDFGGFTQETRIYRVDIPKGCAEPHEVTFRQGGDHHEERWNFDFDLFERLLKGF